MQNSATSQKERLMSLEDKFTCEKSCWFVYRSLVFFFWYFWYDEKNLAILCGNTLVHGPVFNPINVDGIQLKPIPESRKLLVPKENLEMKKTRRFN